MQYTIRAGDTLGGIAQYFGTTIEELLQLNPQITDPNLIIAGQPLQVPDTDGAATADGDLSYRIQRVTEYNLGLADANQMYSFWSDGQCINWDGPPAFAANGAPPAPESVTEIFCAGVGNLDLRLIGKPIPQNAVTSCYDGGTKAWYDTYSDAMIAFDLGQVEEGDVAFRPFQWSAPSDQGHWAYVGSDQGAGNICIQSWPFGGADDGVNATYTIEQSHDGGFYIYLLKAKDWLGG